MATQLDIYGSHHVPFELGTFCRNHKYSPEAVNLSRALTGLESAKKALDRAELDVTLAEQRVAQRVEEVQRKMEGTKNGL